MSAAKPNPAILTRVFTTKIDRLATLLFVLMGTVYIRTGAHVARHKMACVWGRKLLLPAPHCVCLPVCQSALTKCSMVRMSAPSERGASVLFALFGDVFTNDELAGSTRAELL
ncbi:Uncharacterised protein [Schaalia odontolytica]|uniref:Uncharacterized protein n=1 Tax=Schaalia odontolytica TaxID=1660 RepID=A0A2X0UH80_9ACTO|nr:Uncharacterised protein [Schaalia odontolytica]